MLEFKKVICGIHTKSMYIKENAWIRAGTTVLPGVTIGKNAVVAAGSAVKVLHRHNHVHSRFFFQS